jgi:hypothetical protein
MPSQARHGRFRTLVPHPSPHFPPRCPSPVTLLLAPSSHTVQPSILDRARVRDLPPRLAWPGLAELFKTRILVHGAWGL